MNSQAATMERSAASRPSRRTSQRRTRPAPPRLSGEELLAKLRDRIRQGEWKAGERIPRGLDLVREFGVCQNTLGRAFRQLEREGQIVGLQGKGRFVAHAKPAARTRTVGVFVSSPRLLHHPVVRHRLNGLVDTLLARGYFAKFGCVPENGPGDDPDRWGFAPSSVDAVVNFAADASYTPAVRRYFPVPMCVFAHTVPEDQYLNVRHDYLGGAFRSVKHLLDLGHRRVAFITRHEKIGLTRDQCQGAALAVEAMAPARVDYRQIDIPEYTEAHSHDAVAALLADGFNPTGIACGADDIVPGVWRALSEAGLRVPADVSVVGFNDVLTPEEAPLPMTTIRTDYRFSGVQAAELVIRRLEDPASGQWQSPVVPAELVVRGTTAPPRRG